MLDRTQAPASLPVKEVAIQKAESFILTNGLPVHTVRVNSQPVFKIELLLKAAKWNEPQNGVSALATKMLSEGTRTRAANQIADYVDGLGAFLEITPGLDSSSVSIYGMTKHFKTISQLLAELIYESTFPTKELENLKNIRLQNLKIDDEKNNIIASKTFREKLFGKSHPYGQQLKAEQISQINSPLLQYYHQFNMLSGNEIILSGDVPDDLNVLELNFKNNLKSKEAAPFHIMPEQSRGQVVILKEDAVQSSVRVGRRMFTKRHPDYLPMLVVNELLGGYFGSRLMKNIREEKGYTYGISSSVVSLTHQGYFVIGTDVKREYTQHTLDEIFKEIEILKTVPVPAEELETVRNYMAGSLLSSINTPFALADKFKAVHLNGLTYKFYQDYLDTIYNIEQEQIMQLATQYLKRDDMTEVIVGGLT